MAFDESTANGLPADYPEPSPMEAMLFFNILKNVKNQPDIDWDQVAKDTGLKNEATAKKRFYQVKNKLGLDPRAGSSPRTPRKARTAASQDGLDDDVSETPAKATPTKATKRRKTSATASAAPAPDPESPDILSTPVTPTTSVHSTGFTSVNGSQATPSKAKPKGRTPLTSKPRKTPAATPAADVSAGELDVAGADDAALPVAGSVKAEADDAGEI
ncbi:hypothetical protein F503_08109 [Ophiostoma piceae UAMH 11346]|uniref:Myb-like DNA-binding domain-containing protein n=1 Tax=Ophiostoma piceae (strain UAMH 11346) TaxID=1262450 RepID=S3CLR3_OPHP1|nr:hypothetical protein F503_08109 [Ophiostoma piceae UAMH 11346]